MCLSICVYVIFAKYTNMVNAFQPHFPSKVTLYIPTLFAFLSINMIKNLYDNILYISQKSLGYSRIVHKCV